GLVEPCASRDVARSLLRRFIDENARRCCPPARTGPDPPSMRFTLFALLLASACATAHPRGTAHIPATRHQTDNPTASDLAGSRRTADFEYETAAGARADD